MKRLLLILMLVSVAFGASAKKKPTTEYGKGTGKVYIFGVCQQLTDSVVYITSINMVDSIDLEKKTKFLPFRSEFSLQLKEYMEGKMQKRNQTACVFYSANRKKLSKKFYKIKKRFLDNSYTKVVMLDQERFQFQHPLSPVTHEAAQ